LAVNTATTIRLGLLKRLLNLLYERLSIIGNGNDIPPVGNYVGYRCTDNGFVSRHVLQGLRRADVARRLVDGKGHQAHIKALQEVGQPLVRLQTRVIDVGAIREVFLVNLSDWSYHDNRPLRPLLRDLAHQLEVDTLVNDAIVSQHRPRHINYL